MDLSRFKNLAGQMRAAIDSMPREDLPLQMSNFPAGACMDTSLLLGAYLVDLGHIGFELISGTRGSWDDSTGATHAWLARGDLVIDITADQFSDAPAGVIVESSPVWHQQFEGEQIGSGDFRTWRGPYMAYMRAMYSRLLATLSETAPHPNEL